ncbi:MAG: thermonuclease family protein [Actinobacteria bacterium]|nr:thermonuclease family protein [Actinomycetota bacterium]
MSVHVFSLPGEVDRVIDGDSLVVHLGIMPGKELHGEHVRLQGINAPELRHAGGPAARDYLRTLLPEGTPITLVASQMDKYGRLLARVVLADGRDAAEVLLAAGHAQPMAGMRSVFEQA